MASCVICALPPSDYHGNVYNSHKINNKIESDWYHTSCLIDLRRVEGMPLLPVTGLHRGAVSICTQTSMYDNLTGARRSNARWSLEDAIVVHRFFPDLSAGAGRVWYAVISFRGGGVYEHKRLSTLLVTITNNMNGSHMGQEWVDRSKEAYIGSDMVRASYGDLTKESVAVFAQEEKTILDALRNGLSSLCDGRDNILHIIYAMVTDVPFIGFDKYSVQVVPKDAEKLREQLRIAGRFRDYVRACNLLEEMEITVDVSKVYQLLHYPNKRG